MTNQFLCHNRAPKALKLLGGVALSVLMSLAPKNAEAAPQGATMAAGSAEFAFNGRVTTVNQSTNRAVIDWQSFDVAADESVEFKLPSSSGSTLNRIHSPTTTISGSIISNGAVYFTNPNGLVFDATSRVTANGFFAATQAIDATKFMNSTITPTSLTNLGSSEIRLDGSIAAPSITALGGTVSVYGSIDSPQGNMLLSSTNLTTIGSTAVIRADGGVNGNGGRVIIWSDNHTDYLG
ncbi:MAG: filamentous hemagglutinin N-terminal domain-containing protein, partial [Candidatus Pacebacteria bacterium]|nr:filamentous hemagglutinin N-terminal domain-containing protein [Candidatus Paceibacterota bacterium]